MSVITSFCPYCWAEVDANATTCPHCHALLTQDNREYVEKLIAALHHPDPLTQRRAAYILGLLGDERAVPALCSLLMATDDPYLQAEVVTALGAIGGPQAEVALNEVSESNIRSVIVRRAARQALMRLKTS